MARQATDTAPRGAPAHAGVFETVVVGVDGTPEGLEAARQADRLRAAGGTLGVVTVVDYELTRRTGEIIEQAAHELEATADAALAAASEAVPDAETDFVDGEPKAKLLEAAEEKGATLLAVGAHGWNRAIGILLPSVMTHAVHKAGCSVLVARPAGDSASFPRSILVGVDGSEHSLAAYAVARDLAERLDVPLRAVAAMAPEATDEEGLRRVPDLERVEEAPVAALEDRAAPGELLVVGSRGLRGIAALGSVSERVAHTAASSVLVVRGHE